MRALHWLFANGIAICAVAALFASHPADGIPAWARKYSLDCTACHNAGFRLTRMGQDFLRAGHQTEGALENQNLSDHVSIAEKIRYNWGETEAGGVKSGKVNSFEQHALSVYMGGALQKDFAYFAELYWHENSGNTSGSSDLNDFGRSKLADAYLQYLNRQNDETFTSVRFGQFSPYLLHLHGVGARLSQDRPYVINSGTVGDNPYKPFARQYGVEVSQYLKGFNVALALMNGTGGKLFNRVDNDLKKDAYATIDYAFDQHGSMLGVYGYLGHYPLFADNPSTPSGTAETAIPSSTKFTKYTTYDDFSQVGVLGNYARKEGAVIGALFSGKNEFSAEVLSGERVFPVDSLVAVASDISSLGYYAELQLYALHPRVQPFVRFDFWDPNTDADDNEVLGPMAGISWRVLDHGRLVAQYAQLKTRKPAPASESTRKGFVIEANFMF